MSSPASRRSKRSSVNGTPRRRSVRASEAPMSDASLPDNTNAAEERPQSSTPRRAARATPVGSSQNTSQSQAPPTSSPLFFRSSPAGSQSQSQSQSLNIPGGAERAGLSSPLRNVASSEGGQTPRASGAYGGEYCIRCDGARWTTDAEAPKCRPQSIMLLAPTLQRPQRTGSTPIVRARLACS